MKKYLFYIVIVFLFFSCQKVERSTPVNAQDSAPGEVSNIQVKNIPGGATLSYALPESKSLLYVLAEYSIRKGVVLNKKSSYYNNSLTIKGFPKTNTYNVKLYAVSRGGKKSNPVSVEINPLTPPVISIFQSLRMRPTFGGVNVQFENETEAKVKLTVLTPDSLSDLTTADIFYTSWESGDFSVRGYDSIPRRFGVFVRDRWNNYSDTVFAEITPYFEKKLDKSKFSAVQLDNDTYKPHNGFLGETALWDGLETVQASAFQTEIGTPIPQWFTINLGKKVVLSRFKMFHKMNGGAYRAGDPKHFEIWGTNNPTQNGSWANWHLLGSFVNNPPSGEVPATEEDKEYASTVGTDYEFPVGNDAYQYIRFKTIDNWGNVSFIYIGELTFWGSE